MEIYRSHKLVKLFKNAVLGFTIADESFEYNYHTKTSRDS